jgi:hypothetical protein
LYSVEREPRPIVHQAVISNLNLTPLAKHLTLLKAGIENAQGLIDQDSSASGAAWCARERIR